MGFTEFEKYELKSIVRDESRKLFETEFPDEVVKFVKQKGLSNQVEDFVRFPSMKHKATKAENLELHLLCDNSLDLVKVVEEFGEVITLPYSIHIDCSFLIQNIEGNLFHSVTLFS